MVGFSEVFVYIIVKRQFKGRFALVPGGAKTKCGVVETGLPRRGAEGVGNPVVPDQDLDLDATLGLALQYGTKLMSRVGAVQFK